MLQALQKWLRDIFDSAIKKKNANLVGTADELLQARRSMPRTATQTPSEASCSSSVTVELYTQNRHKEGCQEDEGNGKLFLQEKGKNQTRQSLNCILKGHGGLELDNQNLFRLLLHYDTWLELETAAVL